jgi:hypothetical protein
VISPFARCDRRPSHNKGRGVWVPARRPGRRTVAINAAHRFLIPRIDFNFQTACAQTQLRDLAARFARGLLFVSRSPQNQRAQGRPDARCTRGLVCMCTEKCAHEHTGPAENTRPSLRNGFTAYVVVVLVRRALLPPSPARTALTNLTPASGAGTTRFCRPPTSRSSSQRPRPPHLTATYVTTADAPPAGETGGVVKVICPTCQAKYF